MKKYFSQKNCLVDQLISIKSFFSVIETCRTEEFAYISSYDVDSKSPISFSQSSSFDRITVIDKQDEYSEICKEFEKSIVRKKHVKVKNRQPSTIKNQNRKNPKNTAIKATEQREHRDELPQSKNQGDSDGSPVNGYKNLDNPETLVAMNYNATAVTHKKKSPSADKHIESKDFNGIVSQIKQSNGTLHSGSSKAAVDISTNKRKGNLCHSFFKYNDFQNNSLDLNKHYCLQITMITYQMCNQMIPTNR